MTFGEKGTHRENRTGGSKKRDPEEIFKDTFSGKLAEVGFYQYIHNHNIIISDPDFETYGKGAWDSCDYIINEGTKYEKKVAIKSTKHYGNLLLLEEEDWNSNGEYIPNIRESGISTYDYFILIRLKGEGNDTEFNMDKELLRGRKKLVCADEWKIDIAGFLTLDEFKMAIKEKQIIPKGGKLGKRISMDANNYYIQAGDLNPIQDFIIKQRI